jgi:hypothetical protein
MFDHHACANKNFPELDQPSSQFFASANANGTGRTRDRSPARFYNAPHYSFLLREFRLQSIELLLVTPRTNVHDGKNATEMRGW